MGLCTVAPWTGLLAGRPRGGARHAATPSPPPQAAAAPPLWPPSPPPSNSCSLPSVLFTCAHSLHLRPSLAATLAGTRRSTLLAPDNAAFEKLLTALDTNLTALLEDTELLQEVLRWAPHTTCHAQRRRCCVPPVPAQAGRLLWSVRPHAAHHLSARLPAVLPVCTWIRAPPFETSMHTSVCLPVCSGHMITDGALAAAACKHAHALSAMPSALASAAIT